MLLFPCEEAKKQSEASNTTGVEYLDIRIIECRNRVITVGEVYLIAISKGATQVKFDLISTRDLLEILRGGRSDRGTARELVRFVFVILRWHRHACHPVHIPFTLVCSGCLLLYLGI